MSEKEKHPCDDCIHYEKSWGACSLEPFIMDDNMNLPNLPKWKPEYMGKECPNFKLKEGIGTFHLTFTSNKEWTEKELKYGKTIATGYVVGPDLEQMEKEWKKLLDEKVQEIIDHFDKKESEIWVVTPNLGALKVR